MREYLRKLLGIESLDCRIEAIERLILNEEFRLNGFACLKKHLCRPDKPLPTIGGKPIEQD